MSNIARRKESLVKYNKYSSEELTGIRDKRLVAYKDFLEMEEPYNLDHEVAMLRLLLLEQREAIERLSVVNLDETVERFKEILEEDLRVEAMPEEHIPELVEVCSKRFKEIVHEKYGETMLIGPSQLSVLVDTVEAIAKTAERGKKIADGIMVNVSFKGVYDAVQQITQELGHLLTTNEAQVAFVKAVEAMELDKEIEDDDDWLEAEVL